MKRRTRIVGAVLILGLLLGGGAFMAGRLLGTGLGGNDEVPMVTLSTADGKTVKAEFVRAPELPQESPHVMGAYSGRQDNSIFVDETEGGFVVSRGEDDSFSVTNTTGKTSEIVVTSETAVYVDETQQHIDTALVDGKLYQQVESGSIEGMGDLSFVRAWGEKRGDRLIADVLVYSPPPVISR